MSNIKIAFQISVNESKMTTNGFGPLFKAIVTAAADRAHMPLSSFVAMLPEQTSLSERTIWRMFEEERWPKTETMDQLSATFPAMARALSDTHTFRANWETIRIDESRLPKGSTVTIATAGKTSKTIDDEKILASIAQNILEKDFRYVFLHPPHHKIDPEFVETLKIYALAIYLNSNGKKPVKNLNERFNTQVSQTRTSARECAWAFWGMMPSYTMLYNVRAGAEKEQRFPQYAAYWEEGISAACDDFHIEGWTRLDPKYRAALYSLLEDPVNGVLNQETFDAWPVPSPVTEA